VVERINCCHYIEQFTSANSGPTFCLQVVFQPTEFVDDSDMVFVTARGVDTVDTEM